MEKEFLRIAKDDLEISRVAYDLKKYRNAISSLQQANEKVFKSIQIFSGVADMNALKKASHDPFKPILGWITEEVTEGSSNIDKLKNMYQVDDNGVMSPFLQEALNQVSNTVDVVNELKSKPIEHKSSEEYILKEIESLEEFIEIDFSQILEKINIPKLNTLIDLIPILRKYPDALIELNAASAEDQHEKLNELVKNIFKPIAGFMVGFSVASVMNMILNPHFSESRYPNEKKVGHHTYDENHPLIKYYLRLFDLTGIGLSRIEQSIYLAEQLKIKYNNS